MRATSSSVTAFSTAFAAVGPQMNGACPRTRAQGSCAGPSRVDRLDQDRSSVELVAVIDLVACQRPRDRDRLRAEISVSGPIERDLTLRLRPDGRPGRVGVNDGADLREGAVQLEVRGRIGRGAAIALEDLAIEV